MRLISLRVTFSYFRVKGALHTPILSAETKSNSESVYRFLKIREVVSIVVDFGLDLFVKLEKSSYKIGVSK